MKIRESGEEDASVLEQLLSKLYKPQAKWSREKILKDIREKKKRYFLALDGETVLGGFGIEFEKLHAKFGPIVVKEEYQRKGIGSKLIRFAEDIAKENGSVDIYCYSLELYKAKGFYETNKWEMKEFIENFFDRYGCFVFCKTF